MVAHFHANHWIGQIAVVDIPAAPTLSIADNGDGTGAVATISGSTSGSTNTVYTQAFDGELGTATWTSGGNRSGDGNVSLSLSTGHYLAYVSSAKSGATAASTVYYFAVTDTGEAIIYQCLTAVQSRIQALTLSGITNASIVVKKLPIERVFRSSDGIDMPCILITPQREGMPPMAGNNSQDEINYGVLVTIVRSDNQETTLAANLNAFSLWRQKIAKAFRNQRLSGVSEVITASVEPADFIVPAAWRANLLAGALLIRFTSRESRGLS